MLSFQNYLDTFCEAASSGYGCLLINGRVAVATGKWWALAAVELVLLRMLTASLPTCTSRDVPVFLPVTSPEVSERLERMFCEKFDKKWRILFKIFIRFPVKKYVKNQ